MPHDCTKPAWAVILYGGEYDTQWQNVEAVFLDKEEAMAYSEKGNAFIKSLETYMDTLHDIEEMLLDEEFKRSTVFFESQGEDLNDDEYDAFVEEFENTIKYELIEEKFKIGKDEYLRIKSQVEEDARFYGVCETVLYLNEKQ